MIWSYAGKKLEIEAGKCQFPIDLVKIFYEYDPKNWGGSKNIMKNLSGYLNRLSYKI